MDISQAGGLQPPLQTPPGIFPGSCVEVETYAGFHLHVGARTMRSLHNPLITICTYFNHLILPLL